MLTLGTLSLTLALIFASASILFLALGSRWDRKDLIRNGYYAVYGFFLATLIASAVLLQAFLKQDYTFAYVAAHSEASLSTFYRVAGFWAGQEGSFLFWLLLVAIAVVVIALLDLNRLTRLTAGAVMVMCAIGAVFAALMLLDSGSDPFVAGSGGVASGLNPLLLHPGMVLHPPTLFIGYVGLAVPFAFAVSTLLLGRADKQWVRLSQKWAVGGWLFLTLGIGLGAWWAYVVLTFGGYWAWDPVENTSFVPWLTATALLHAFTLYKARGIFKRWALSLAALTFFFTILATWTTRTGLISSVHAFGRNQVLTIILSSFLVAIGLVSVGLIAWRARRFEGPEQSGSLLSRDFLYYATTLLLTLFAVAVAFGTVGAPLLLQRTVGAATYDALAQPLGVLVLAMIAVCPLLAWRRTEGVALGRALILPGITAAASVPLWLALGFQSNLWGFLGLVICGFAFGGILQFVAHAARRAAGADRSLWAGLPKALSGSRSRTAGYIVHLGMVLIVAGLLGSAVYKSEVTGLVKTKVGGSGSSLQAGDYVLRYGGMRSESGAQSSERTFARLDVLKGGAKVGEVEPHSDVYPVSGATVRAVIMGGWRQDLFVVADQPFDSSSGEIALRIVVFPLVRFVWLGSILLCVGAVVSLWPRGRTQEQEARAPALAAWSND